LARIRSLRSMDLWHFLKTYASVTLFCSSRHVEQNGEN
jgi:hypothetical protein